MINFRYVLHPTWCGYFCLKKIIKNVKVKKKSYMSLDEVCKILRMYNYSCVCLRVTELELVNKECLSLVKKKNSYHYVIIKKVDDNYVYVYDPLWFFVRRKKKKSFLKKWSGICVFYVNLG